MKNIIGYVGMVRVRSGDLLLNTLYLGDANSGERSIVTSDPMRAFKWRVGGRAHEADVSYTYSTLTHSADSSEAVMVIRHKNSALLCNTLT